MNLRSRPVLIGVAVVLTVIVVGSLAVWTLRSNKEPTTQVPSPGSPTPTQVTTSGLCKDFETLAYAKYPISCRQAVDIALEQAPGKVQKVSIDPVPIFVPSESGSREMRDVDMWLIDIALTNSYYDEKFEKEIRVLQVGIPLDGQSGIYKKPLE